MMTTLLAYYLTIYCRRVCIATLLTCGALSCGSLVAAESVAPPVAAIPAPTTTPQAAKLSVPDAAVTSNNNVNTLQMQQDTETKYIMALNELQMLKIAKELADVNQAIINSKLATVQAEKNLLNALKSDTGPSSNTAQNSSAYPESGESAQQTAPAPSIASLPSPTAEELPYTVVSVSQLHRRWSAVLSYAGKLYHVHVGDVIPPNQFKVVTIDQGGITVAKNGIRHKISLVQII